MTTPDDVYRHAGRTMFRLDLDDEESLFEWHPCDHCPVGACACAGVPYPSAPVRAAIDVGREDLAAKIADLKAERDDALAAVRTLHDALREAAAGEGS